MNSNVDNLELTNVIINNTAIKDDDNGSDDPGEIVDGIVITFAKTNQWSSGDGYTAQYDFVLSNESGTSISSWEFEIVTENSDSLVNIWNANYIVNDNLIKVSNASYNGVLSHRDTVTVGTQIFFRNPNFIPVIQKVKGVP